MLYLTIFIILLTGELTYFFIAKKYKIVDKPNSRSSHATTTIRGAGIVLWLAAVCYTVWIHSTESFYFLTAMTLLSFISFRDDISPLRNRVRIVVHFMSVFILFSQFYNYISLPGWAIIASLIVCVGMLNAFNFMDGINGMTGLYNLLLLLFLQYINKTVIAFANPELMWFAAIFLVIFLFFNFRKQAICFIGDVGSLGIALWVIYLLIKLMIATNSIAWILLVAVYGVDTTGTIIYRLIRGKSIFRAHRMFFFQRLSNEMKISQLTVSSIYASTQLIIDFILLYVYLNREDNLWTVSILILAILTAVYLLGLFPSGLKNAK